MPQSASNRILFGELINQRRNELDLKLKHIAKFCGVSTNFISLVERGLKSPRDEVISKLAEILELDENSLFEMLDKIPPSINSVINEHDGFRELLGELSKKVKDEKLRNQLYVEVYDVYVDFLKRNNLE
ncbi:helix-turn-helix domain-containing protein [Paenibacillus agilis]|uniref:helix-turn-helix domain-containing protein n=1 Tax=Paenibacillus agilis TaxID=3020863 RepID=UPI0021BD612E|nr:helix-turn-helix transcriptional regulator [Paenibacillus agilis]